jgi:dipeptidyl-peptidase-4
MMRIGIPKMKSLALLCLAITAGLGGQIPQSLLAQRPTVLRDQLEPNWSEDGQRFWYQVDLSRSGKEFWVVDAQTGVRSEAFEPVWLAGRVSELTGEDLPASRLNVERLEFGKEPAQLVIVTRDGKRFLWNREAGELEWQNRDHPPAAEGLLFLPPRPSARETASADIDVANKMSYDLELVWINWDGQPVSYGSIKSQGTRSLSTYEGHVWMLRRGDQPIGCFVAKPGLNSLEVNEALVAAVQQQPPAGRAGENQRRSRRGNRPPAGGTQATSPDRKYDVYVRQDDLFLKPREREEELRLTSDATPQNSFQRDASRDRLVSMQFDRADFPAGTPHVYWAPNSDYVLAMQTTRVDEPRVYYVQSSPADQLQPKLHHYPYAKPGDPIPVPTPRLFRVSDGQEIALDASLMANPFLLRFERWSADGQRAYLFYNQRGHQRLRLLEIELQTGAVKPIIDEYSPTFIHYSTGGKSELHWLPENQLLWASERSGWNHLYRIDAATGEVLNPVTSGDWNVRRIENIDRENQVIWFYAVGVYPDQDPYHSHFCRVNLDGSGFRILTEGDGNHTIAWSPNRDFFIDRYSRVDLPPVHELRRSADGQLICSLEKGIWSGTTDNQLPPFSSLMPERFVAKGRDGQTDIWGVVYWPGNFDPNRKYPVIENIYAGPHDHHVPKNFSARSGQGGLSEAGFVVVRIDGMGTAWRSKAFHDVCYQNLKDAGFPDRIAWMRALAEKYPQLDLQRVGIFGGSAGGQNAMAALLWHHDFYKVAVADCGCHDNRMDKIWWNEQWMGELGDSSHYIANSNVENANLLQGQLMLTVGEMDRNVDPASTMQVVDALIRANKDFVFLPIPNGGHGAGGSAYGAQRRLDFFRKHLAAEQQAKQ